MYKYICIHVYKCVCVYLLILFKDAYAMRRLEADGHFYALSQVYIYVIIFICYKHI